MNDLKEFAENLVLEKAALKRVLKEREETIKELEAKHAAMMQLAAERGSALVAADKQIHMLQESRAALEAQEQRTRGELNKLRAFLAGPPPRNTRDDMLAQVQHLSKLCKMVLQAPENWLRNSSTADAESFKEDFPHHDCRLGGFLITFPK